MRLGIQLLLILLATIINPGSARADVGIRMLHYACDEKKNEILIEPFILWNGNTDFQRFKLQDPEARTIQKIGNDIFYDFNKGIDGYKKDPELKCNTDVRAVTITLKQEFLTVTEITNKVPKTFGVSFYDGICYAWDVYGPTFKLKSSKNGNWESCFGRENNGNLITKCSPISSDEPACPSP